MKEKMRIVLGDAGSVHNKGDAAIFFSILKQLKNKFPNAEFVALSNEPGPASKLYGIKAYYAPYTVPYTKFEDKILRKRFIKLFFRGIRFMLFSMFFNLNQRFAEVFITKMEKKSLYYYKDAHLALSSGGNAITDDYIGTLYFLLEIFWITKVIFKTPFVIYAYSIGPFHYKPYKMLASYVLNKVDMITLREEVSKSVVKELKITKPKIVMSADAAFLFEGSDKKRAKQLMKKEKLDKLKRPLIGISVSKWDFKLKDNSEKIYQRYKKSVASSLDYMIDKYNANVVFISTGFKGGKDNYTDDSYDAVDIRSTMKNKEHAVIFRNEYNPQDIKAVIGSMDLFIGTRAHSTIFATTSFIPTVGVAYEFKTQGFLGLMGVGNYAIYMVDVSEDKLIKLVEDAWKNRKQIKQRLKKQLPIVKKRALLSADATKKFVDGYYERK